MRTEASMTLPQLVSVFAIDPVVSTMIATFHGCALPCIDAIAVALTVRVLKPNTGIKRVLMVAVSVTFTALGTLPEALQVVPVISMLRHIGVTVGVMTPRLEL